MVGFMITGVIFTAIALALLAIGAAVANRARASQAERRYPPSGRFLAVGGCRYHCLIAGRGPPVVLLHGSGASAHDWDQVSAALADEFTTIAIDRPGHGHSERPPRDAGNPTAQAGVVHQLLQQLGITQAIIVGHSWSGALALAYALAFPSEVRGVVLAQGTVYLEPKLINTLLILLNKPVIGPVLAYTIVPWLGRSRIDDTLRNAFAPQPVPEHYRRQALAMWLRPSQARAIAADTLGRHNTIGELSARYADIRSPLSLVCGEADRYICPDHQSLALARALPSAKLRLVPDAGHQLPLTHPIEVATTIRDLARRASRLGST